MKANNYYSLWRLLFFVCVIFNFHFIANAQSGKIPPFRILKTDGKVFNAESLQKEKPVLIIYYSPDCEHCQQFMTELFRHISQFSQISIVMITFYDVESVKVFEKKYKIQKFPNIISGTEGTSYFVRDYYKIIQTPFAALYDRQGYFIFSYYEEISITDLISRVKQLG